MMKIKIFGIGILLGLLAGTGSLEAADFHVANPKELQEALTTAAHNQQDDVIYLAAGTYKVSENMEEKEKGLYFRYEAEPEEKFGLSLIGSRAEGTIIDGEGKARGLF